MSEDDPINGLWFSIAIEEDEYIAFISFDALHIHFNAPRKSDNALLRTYLNNQETIDAAALRKFLNGAARPIKLSVGDF
jgi:hypothetical protein